MYVVISVNNEGKAISDLWVKEGFSGIQEGDIYEHEFEGPCKVLRIEKDEDSETLIVLHPHYN